MRIIVTFIDASAITFDHVTSLDVDTDYVTIREPGGYLVAPRARIDTLRSVRPIDAK